MRTISAPTRWAPGSPLANVERVEVVLGPGSVLHGGYAALGVINIVTRNADHGTGSRAGCMLGHSNGAFTRTSAHIGGAHRLSRNQEIGYLVSHSRGNRSNAQRLSKPTARSYPSSIARPPMRTPSSSTTAGRT
ncbi:MAG: hypothetical protein IPN62_16640 [Flavobacteriales bacterium]|nr:hypothetical protein [Flavobacteriales bacterium]